MKQNKIIFVNRYFYPDHSATSQILTDLVFHLSLDKYTIEIVTSQQRYDNPGAKLKKTETINGVRVNRIKTTRFGRQNLLGRFIDYISFYFNAFIYLLLVVKSGDIVVAKTDPPLISIIAAVVCKLKGAVLINWLQDLFPEVAVSLGVKGMSVLNPLLIFMRNWSLKSAYTNVAIGDKMSLHVLRQGIDANKVSIVHNWSIENDIVPIDTSENILRKKWGLVDKFVIGYSGNIGRAHEFDTLINAAEILKEHRDIIFLIIGAGAQFNKIKSRVRELGLDNVRFEGYQPKNMLKYSLTLPDLHVISLLPELEGLILPSKFYGIAASGRPVLYIGATDGEIPQILSNYNCGFTAKINDYDSIVTFIKQLNGDPKILISMGQNARSVFVDFFDKRFAYEKWEKLFKSL